MKKLLALFLLLTMLCSVSAASALEESEIVLVGGVTFGMTMDEVISTASANGCEAKLWTADSEGVNWSQCIANAEARGMSNPAYVSVSNATLSGHPVYVGYYFDDQDKLISVEYSLTYKSSSTNKTRTDFFADQYVEFESMLTSKYGAPSAEDINLYPRVFVRRSGKVTFNPIEHAYRLLALDDGAALYIEHFFSDRVAPNGMTYEVHTLGYTLHDAMPAPPEPTAAPDTDWGI